MKISNASAYSITKVIDNNILYSKDGSIAFVYELHQPEKYSINEQRLDIRLKEFLRAFEGVSKNVYIHKQDIYLKKEFDTSLVNGDMYLSNALRNHFQGRVGIEHTCIISFVITGLKSLDKAYLKSPFNYNEKLEIEDKTLLVEFQNSIERACNILDTIFRTKIIALSEDKLKSYIAKYVNLFEPIGFYDIDFNEKKIGDNHFDMLAICESDYLPKSISNIQKDPISKEDYTIFQGFIDDLGETFFGNHIYNQLIFLEGDKNIKNELDFVRDELGKVKTISEKVHQKYIQLDNFLTEVEKPQSQVVMCKSHFNLVLFDKDKEQLAFDKQMAKSILNSLSIKFFQPQSNILKNLFLGSIIGREKKLDNDFFFISHLKESLCLFTTTTPQKSDKEGIWFNDRIYNLPLRIDLWDSLNKRMNARNGIIIANTGGGKSVFALNFITQFLEQKVNIVVAEFGRSFEFITNLYPEISTHIAWKPDTPLGINPFDLQGGILSDEKLFLLKTIILKLWRVKDLLEDSHVSTSINRLLKEYYSIKQSNHYFEDFYYFVVYGGEALLEKLDIDKEYFNLKSFKHNASEFIESGVYENVFKVANGVTQLIKEKQLVVFELTQIKKDPFLVSLVLLILNETIDSNILADKSKKGILIFDEFAETKDIKDTYSSSSHDTLATVSILYQKIRKENGAVYIIIQDPSQLPDNNFTQGIIANTQVLVVLPSNRSTAEVIKNTYKLSEHDFDMIMSLKNNKEKSAKYKYSEQWIRLHETTFTTRLELSKEALLSFQTEGEVWKKLNDDFKNTNNLQETIDKYKIQNII